MDHAVLSVVPPVVAIILALLTKEVYVSLLLGIFCGVLIYTDFSLTGSVLTMIAIMDDKIGGNINILIFLVILGILVAVITQSGAVRVYGEWALESIKGKRNAMLVTALLGIVIFIDDYFNCLTVGTVMRPVTDKFKIARTKLAYIIDATAAPICIIAPVSSWAAAVGSSLPEDSPIDGFSLFLQTIPFNLYALLTLLFLFFIIWTGRDFSAMAKSVLANKEHFEVPVEYHDTELATVGKGGNGKIIDLFLPLAALIAASVYGMLYTGGFEEGKSIAEAFANCDSSKSLVFGSFVALTFTAFLYLPRRVMKFEEFCAGFSAGFKAMTPAIFILCLAWTLSGIESEKYLNLGGYVGGIVDAHSSLTTFLPPIFFLVAMALAFATGTSWGTFGILIPIAVAIFDVNNLPMLSICVAAILSGAVGGDHASPISDTTILASAGAECHHLDHVRTQLPYVLTVAAASLIGYVADGITQNGWVGLAVGSLCIVLAMIFVVSKFPAVDEGPKPTN